TYCYINQQDEYSGGLISPGISISMDALYKYASKLPKIEIEKPEHIIGKSTIQAMQSSVFHDFVGQVDGIIKQINDDVDQDDSVSETDGLTSLGSSGLEAIYLVDPHLT